MGTAHHVLHSVDHQLQLAMTVWALGVLYYVLKIARIH